MGQPTQPLRVLILEDNRLDAQLMLEHLQQGGYTVDSERVESEPDFLAALETNPDVILADYNVPSFGATRALGLLRASGARAPMIVVSGTIGEETAVEMLRSGAADYLLKDRMARLSSAVSRVLEERKQETRRLEAERRLKEAEERTRFALAAAGVGVWEIDIETGAMRWSPMHEALHGMPAESFAGTVEAFLNAVHPDDCDNVRRAMSAAAHATDDSEILYRVVWPDESLHWIRISGRLVLDATGRPFRAAGIGIDVTDRHLLEERTRQTQKVEAIGQLAGGIAHDFNNLLTAILGHCELLGDELGAGSSHLEDLDEIRRAADRAVSLIRQLLAFSRRQMLEPRVLDVRDSVRGMEPMLKRLIGEDLKVSFQTTDTPARVRADPGQIEQVILNLAINARDAMPRGGSLTIEVTTLNLLTMRDIDGGHHGDIQPGPHVVLSVSDTGTGMDAVTQARIFEPFFTTKPRGSGTGLGLSTVYGIVTQSGGSIWVESEVGRGSTFKVYLPAVGAEVDRAAAAAPAERLTGSETILLVEDEPAVRELVRRILGGRGYHVLAAGTPPEALALLHQPDQHVDLLISDVVLPDMSGRSLANEAMALSPGMRVMFISGYTDQAIIERGELEPGTPFLQKPLRSDALARKVREVLDSAH